MLVFAQNPYSLQIYPLGLLFSDFMKLRLHFYIAV